jgi:RNA-directed DNA polymerase
MKLKERIYQATTQVNVLSPEMSLFVEADTFHFEGRQYCSYDIAKKLQLYRGLRQLITRKAQRDKNTKFTSLMHLFNKEILKECFLKLRKNVTAGVDDVTIEMYENNLDANLEQLVGRLREKWYKPKPVCRCFIPKNSKGELRPLGIPSVKDKIVQMLLKEILKAIYEPVFRGCSHGFRPERNCHTAVKQLNDAVIRNPVNYVVEVDIHKFFDSVDHIWLLKFLKHRIVDPNILWLVRKFLKAGIMETGKVPTFDFLGFTHYCGKTRKGWFMMGHKTSKLRLS